MTIARSLAILVVVAASSRAHAQRAEADALFVEGKRLLKEGKIAEACDKLEASEHLESSVGTLLNLGDCREKNKQPSKAWAAFRKAAADAKRAGNDAKREAEARKRAAALEKKLDYLTITVATNHDKLVIQRDDVEVEHDLWNQAAPIDPGTHHVRAEAPGFKPFARDVTIDGEGKRESIEIVLEPEPKAPVVTPPPHVEPRPLPPPPPPAPTGMTGKRKAAIALGITGVVVGGAGIALGLHAKSLESDADKVCPTNACSDPRAVSQNSDARTFGLYANIGFGVGGAAAVTAVVLWLIGGPSAAEHVAVAPRADGAAVVLGGRF